MLVQLEVVEEGVGAYLRRVPGELRAVEVVLLLQRREAEAVVVPLPSLQSRVVEEVN